MTEEKKKDELSWRDLIPEELEDFLALSWKDKLRIGRLGFSVVLLFSNKEFFSLYTSYMFIYFLYAAYGFTKTPIYKKIMSRNTPDNQLEKNMEIMDKEALRGLFEGAVLNEPQIVIAQSGSKVVYKEMIPEKKEPPQVTDEQITIALEKNKTMFWAQSAWAVFFCVCRDHLGLTLNMTEMEHYINGLPITQEMAYECPKGTIQKALANNPYMNLPINKWKANGGKERAILLAEKLIAELSQQ